MENEELNVGGGQFGQAIGGADALRASMQRRGIDSSILDQVSPMAAGPASPVAPELPQSTSNIAPSIDQTLQTTASQAQQNTPFRSGESETAIKALSQVAKIEAKIAETLAGTQGL